MKGKWLGQRLAHEAEVRVAAAVARKVILALLLLGGVVLRTHEITYCWTTDFRGQCGSFYSNIARNFVKHGFLATKFTPVESINPRSPEEFRYYVNHPPLLEWLVALSFKAFGISEFSARLVPLVFSFLTMILIYLLAKRLWNVDAALCVLAVFCVLPMGVFYGTLVDVQGVLPLFFILLVMYLYERFVEHSSRRALILLYAAFIIGMLSDWPVYYLGVLLPLYHLLMRRKHKLAIAGLLPAALLMLAAYVLYANWIRTGRLTFDTGYIQYLGASRGGHESLSLTFSGKIAARTWEIWEKFFSLPALALLGAWLVVVPVMRILRKGAASCWMIWFFFIFGILHIALFIGPAQGHEYWSYYLLPSAAMAVGLTIHWAGRLASRIKRGSGGVAQVILVLVVAGGSHIQTQGLYRDLSQIDFAVAGAMMGKVCDGESYILVDWDGYHLLDFYLHNQTFYGPINRANYRLTCENPRARYILMKSDRMEEKQRFARTLFESVHEAEREKIKKGDKDVHYGELPLAKMLDTRGLKRFEYPDEIGAPGIESVEIQDRRIIVRWSHPAGKAVTFRVYTREDKTPFYSLGADVAGGNEAVVPNYAREKLWIIVVAVDKSGEESEFDVEIQGWRDE